jgi:hypothetical protein
MTYFGYPLDMHGWKTRPETEPDKFRSSEPENRGRKIQTKPKLAGPETRGYPTQNRPITILKPVPLPGGADSDTIYFALVGLEKKLSSKPNQEQIVQCS